MDFRKVERRTVTGCWEVIPFSDLRQDDQFKLHDEPGGIEDGTNVYTALSDAEPWPPEGNFQVQVDASPDASA